MKALRKHCGELMESTQNSCDEMERGQNFTESFRSAKIPALPKTQKLSQMSQFCAKKSCDSIQSASGLSKSIDSNVLTALGDSGDGFPGAKMVPRGSHRRPKMRQERAIAQMLMLLAAFLAIFVLVQSHDPVLNHFFRNFRTFSNVVLAMF